MFKKFLIILPIITVYNASYSAAIYFFEGKETSDAVDVYSIKKQPRANERVYLKEPQEVLTSRMKKALTGLSSNIWTSTDDIKRISDLNAHINNIAWKIKDIKEQLNKALNDAWLTHEDLDLLYEKNVRPETRRILMKIFIKHRNITEDRKNEILLCATTHGDSAVVEQLLNCATKTEAKILEEKHFEHSDDSVTTK
jgi:hypothetical protein